MKSKIELLFVALFMLVASSCQKKGDSDILSTIPVDTEFFVVAEGNDIFPAAEVIVTRFDKTSFGEKIQEILIENSEIIDKTRPMAFFEYKGAKVLSLYLSQPGAFREAEDKKGHKFSEKDGILDNGEDVFICDDQLWIGNGATTFDATAVKRLLSLKENESLGGIDYARTLADGSSDVAGWLSAEGLVNMMPENGFAAMAMSLLFEDMKYVPFTVKFDDGKATAEIKAINGKYQPSKYLFNPATIDLSTVKEFPGRGDIFVAVAVDSDQLKQLVGQFGMLLGGMPLATLAGNIEGTVVGSANSSADESEFAAQIVFDNTDAARQGAEELMKLFAPSEAAVEQTGNKVYLHTHTLGGKEIAGYASMMEGAEIAVVMAASRFDYTDGLITGTSLTGRHDGDSLKFIVTIDTKKGRNSLTSILEASQMK